MKNFLNISLLVIVFNAASCTSQPSNNEKAQSDAPASTQEGQGESAATQDQSVDTTINMSSGGGTGTNQSKADTLAGQGKSGY